MGVKQLELLPEPMIDPEEVKRITEETLKKKSNESPSKPQGHPRYKPISEAEKRLGWAGRYYGNDPDEK